MRNDPLSGNLMLKIIIRKIYLDTNAMESNIWLKSNSFDSYIVTFDNKIVMFNMYVKLLDYSLRAMGGLKHDILTSLFKGYTVASDKICVSYMTWKQESDKKKKLAL